MTTVVFVLLPGVHLLDLAGPAQAFFTAGDFGRPYDLRYVSGVEPDGSAGGGAGGPGPTPVWWPPRRASRS